MYRSLGDDGKLTLRQLWDTAGQERFRCVLLRIMYRLTHASRIGPSHGIITVEQLARCSSTTSPSWYLHQLCRVCHIDELPCSRGTFENLSRWLADVKALASPDVVVVLVGNKLDQEEKRQVDWAEASQWATFNGKRYSSPSAAVHLFGSRCTFRRSVLVGREGRRQPFSACCSIDPLGNRIWHPRSRAAS